MSSVFDDKVWECVIMAQLHVTRVRREFREVVNSEEVQKFRHCSLFYVTV